MAFVETSSLASGSTLPDPAEAFLDLCRLTAEFSQMPAARLRLCDETGKLPPEAISHGEAPPTSGPFIERFEQALAGKRGFDTLEGRNCFIAGVPIRIGGNGRLVGVLTVVDHRSRSFSKASAEMLEIIARRVIDIRQHVRVSARLAEKNRLAELRAALASRITVSDVSLDEVLLGVAKVLSRYLKGAAIQFWWREEDRLVLAAGTPPPRENASFPLAQSRLAQVVETLSPLTVTELPLPPDPSDPPPGDAPPQAFIGFPLLVRDEMVAILTIHLWERLPDFFLNDLHSIGYLIAQGIHHQQAVSSLSRRERVARFLAQASADLAEVTDYASTLQKVANAAVPDFADFCSVFLLEEGGQLNHVALAHIDLEMIRRVKKMIERYQAWLPGLSGVTESGHSELLEVIPDQRFVTVAQNEEHLAMLRSIGLVSSINVPLVRRGEIFGVMTFYTAESGRRFDLYDLYTAEDLARRASVALENASLYQQLQAADRQKDEFLATLAHELRNPLAPMSHALELLRQEPATPAPELLDILSRQLRQMVRLIDDLLDISRITHNRLRLQPDNCDLSEIIQTALETSRPLADAAGHSLEVLLPGEPLPLHADPARVAQVIANLLNNAAKYTPPGGKIRLLTEADEERFRVVIEDNGVGIAPEMLQRVFDPFAQVRNSLSSAQGGMGIGLTLVRRLIHLHGGEVRAESKGLGKGSRFIIDLPRSSRTETSHPTSQANPTTPERDAEERRLLIVDDNRDAADTLARLLKRSGFDIRVVHDGPEALALARKFRPELVLLDIGLPSLNGYEVARTLRAELRDPEPLLIAMTGWGQESDLRRAQEAGFNHHLLKPVDLDELKACLKGDRPPAW